MKKIKTNKELELAYIKARDLYYKMKKQLDEDELKPYFEDYMFLESLMKKGGVK